MTSSAQRVDRLGAMAARDVAEVARLLGLEAVRGGLRPCPACGAEVRGKGSKGAPDKRPPVVVYQGGRRWKCHAAGCDAGGDALALAAWWLTGRPQPGRGDRDAWRELLAALEGVGLVPPSDAGAPPVRAPVVPPPRSPTPEPPPARLPPAEVADLWASAWGVTVEDRARRWLWARGLDPLNVAALNLARGLPPAATWPRWARIGRDDGGGGWPTDREVQAPGGSTLTGAWSLLLPCYDARGAMVALRARWTGATWDAAADRWVELRTATKERSPAGHGACRGTVYADPVGRWLLERGPEARPGDPAGDGAPLWNGRVLVLEGGPGWLRYASEPGRLRREDGAPWRGPEDGPAFATAVLGVWAGAWPDDAAGRDLAGRLPPGARVTLATDDDGAGEGYADAIARTLNARGVDLRRWRTDART